MHKGDAMTETPRPDHPPSDTSEETLETVILPHKDATRLREMIERDRSLSVVGKYLRNVMLIVTGVLLPLVLFWGEIKKLLGLGGTA